MMTLADLFEAIGNEISVTEWSEVKSSVLFEWKKVIEDHISQPQPVAQGEAVALSYGDVPDKRTWEEKVRIMREAVGRWIVLDQGLWKVTKTDFVEGWRPANEKPQAVCDLEFMMGPLTKKNLSGYHVSIDDLAKSINPGSPHSHRTIITTPDDMPIDAVDEAKVFEEIWKESTEIGVISLRAAEFVWHSAMGYARSYTTPTIPTGHKVVPVVLPDEIGLTLCAPISVEWMARRTGYREGWNACLMKVRELNSEGV